jgi:hypothetical protein
MITYDTYTKNREDTIASLKEELKNKLADYE